MIYHEAYSDDYEQAEELNNLRIQINLLNKEYEHKLSFNKMNKMDTKKELYNKLCTLTERYPMYDFLISPIKGIHSSHGYSVHIMLPTNSITHRYFTWLREGRPIGDTALALVKEIIDKYKTYFNNIQQ
jgi:hypothetical protein